MGIRFGALMLLLAFLPRAQAADGLGKLDCWVGAWQGSGWTQFPGSPRIVFDIVERVQKRAGGNVLLVDGQGTASGPNGARTVTHDGIALVTFDKQAQRYRWQGYDAGRDAVDVEAVVRDCGIAWSIPAGDGKTVVRFTIDLDQREWREVGEIGTGGGPWTKFMEMTLRRQDR